MLINRLKIELGHFRKLTPPSQKLLISYTFFAIAYPILGIFVNAYLWRNTNSMYLVGLYNLSFVLGLCIGFYINGRLLNKIKVHYLYLLGCLLQGTIIFMLVLFSVIMPGSIFIFGLSVGIGSAFFWANKHFLTLSKTVHESRFYFNSLESFLNIVISVVVPFIIGWFIVFGEKTKFYSTEAAYVFVSLFALLSLTITGLIIKNLDVDVGHIQSVVLRNESKKWNMFRVVTFLMGVSDGILLFIPTLLILILLGQEDTLGTVQSFAAILSGIGIYLIGRKVSIKNRFRVALLGVFALVLGTLVFGIFYGSIAAIIYVGLTTISNTLIWTPYQNLNFETIEDEEKIHHHHRYSYIFDQELYLNLGRTAGILFFLLFIYLVSQTVGLRYTPFIIAVTQIPMILIFRKIEKLRI